MGVDAHHCVAVRLLCGNGLDANVDASGLGRGKRKTKDAGVGCPRAAHRADTLGFGSGTLLWPTAFQLKASVGWLPGGQAAGRTSA